MFARLVVLSLLASCGDAGTGTSLLLELALGPGAAIPDELRITGRRDGHPLHAFERLRVDRRAIRRVEVVGDDFRGEIEQPPEVADRLDEAAEGAFAREVTEVLAEKRFAASHQRERALQFGATGEDRVGGGHR